MQQSPGWKLLDEKIQTIRSQLVERLIKEENQETRRKITGIDLLYETIHTIYEQAKIEKMG